MSDDVKFCSICQGIIDVDPRWSGGHNAQPVNDGRCCTACNELIVVQARMRLMMRADAERRIAKHEEAEKP